MRALPAVDGIEDAAMLFERADGHGMAGVLLDAWRTAGLSLPSSIERHELLRDAARECDHAAHINMLRRVDEALDAARLRGVVLKGALLAQRLYPRPAARPTSDIDLLVAEEDVARVVDVLAPIGYLPCVGPEEDQHRRYGHHLHLLHPAAPPLELHFHAYRGFGGVVRSEPLLERSIEMQGFGRLRVLAPDDELFYLAVHAAAHRFGRLGWLYDLVLLLRKNDVTIVDAAFDRARTHRMERPLALALAFLASLLGVTSVTPAAQSKTWRQALLFAITEEPEAPLARSLSRFAYSLALCNDWRAAQRYARRAIAGRVDRLVTRRR